MGMVMRKHIEEIAEDLPEEKQHHEIGAGDHTDQHEIRETDHRQIPARMAILIHVPDRVAVDDDADAGDQGHHDRAQPVHVEPDRDGEGGDGREIVEPNDNGTAAAT